MRKILLKVLFGLSPAYLLFKTGPALSLILNYELKLYNITFEDFTDFSGLSSISQQT
jgi:hypothetical protein